MTAVERSTIDGARVERRGPVGWIVLQDYEATMREAAEHPETPLRHTALVVAEALHEFRFDPAIRAVVITGENDGEFYRVVRDTGYLGKSQRDRLNPILLQGWGGGMVTRIYETLAFMEKPVIARMNGDAIGLGQAFLWGCDFVVARDDAVVADVHTGQGDVVDSAGEVRGFPWAVTPGDGAMSFAPLYMPPTKLKEYMFLSRTWTAKQLAEMNIVNYAVPADRLDATVDELIEKILARPAYVIARAKRVCNKHMVNQLNLTQDLASAYEGLDFFTHAAAGDMD